MSLSVCYDSTVSAGVAKNVKIYFTRIKLRKDSRQLLEPIWMSFYEVQRPVPWKCPLVISALRGNRKNNRIFQHFPLSDASVPFHVDWMVRILFAEHFDRFKKGTCASRGNQGRVCYCSCYWCLMDTVGRGTDGEIMSENSVHSRRIFLDSWPRYQTFLNCMFSRLLDLICYSSHCSVVLRSVSWAIVGDSQCWGLPQTS